VFTSFVAAAAAVADGGGAVVVVTRVLVVCWLCALPLSLGCHVCVCKLVVS
jgi:hypothetical protein